MSLLTRRAAIIRPRSAVSYDADALAYFTACTTQPDDTRKGLINTLIVDAKAAGVWSKLGRIALMASHTEQAGLRDVRNPAQTLVNTNCPFTADRGFSGEPGSEAYLDLNQALTATGLAQNDGTIGVYCNAQGFVSGNSVHFSGTTSSYRWDIRAHESASPTFRAASTATSTFTRLADTRTGHRTIVRRDASNHHIFQAGANKQSFAVASTGNGTGAVLLRSGTVTFSDDRLAAFYCGAALSDAEVAAWHGVLQTYLSAIGAAY